MRLHFHIWKEEKEMQRDPNGFWTCFRACIICGEKQYHWTFWNKSGWEKIGEGK